MLAFLPRWLYNRISYGTEVGTGTSKCPLFITVFCTFLGGGGSNQKAHWFYHLLNQEKYR